jgi:hypothetical protein
METSSRDVDLRVSKDIVDFIHVGVRDFVSQIYLFYTLVTSILVVLSSLLVAHAEAAAHFPLP